MVLLLSPELIAAGHRWKLGVSPGGKDGDHKDKVAAFLHWQGPAPATPATATLDVKFTLRIVNQIPGKAERKVTFSSVFKSVGVGQGYGSLEMLTQADMADETLGWKVNGRVLLECDIAVLGEVEQCVLPSTFLPTLEGSTLQQDMLAMLNDSDSADVTFIVGEQRFPAHTFIISARSSVLRAMLSAPMAEAQSRVVTVKDIDPSVFNSLLRFMYAEEFDSGRLEEEGALEALLAASDKYDVPRLQRLCERALCESTSVDNVLGRLVFADAHGPCSARLREHCVLLAGRNWAVLTTSEGFLNLPRELMSEVMQQSNGTRKRPREEAEEGDGAAAAAELTAAKVLELRVSELKAELARRGLSTAGLKADLRARLAGALGAAGGGAAAAAAAAP